MDQLNNDADTLDNTSTSVPESSEVCKSKPKYNHIKRKSDESGSSSDDENKLPENILETEKHLHASAIKNNLDENSVRKILKRVVTNDHVLALVKLQAEEEACMESAKNKPTTLTRSKTNPETSSLLPSALKKSKTPAERQREYRLRRKHKILNDVEQENRRERLKRKNQNQKKIRDQKRIIKKNKNIDKSAKKSRADYQREYRLRKKNINVDLYSDLAEVIPRQEAGSSRELMKVSPKGSSWKTWDLHLTPIKHIPVKTRPEVTALITQDLAEDEDDDEYEPTHEDVQSDDEQTLESSSDVDSQPRTPVTPGNKQPTTSPMVVKDGPFVVPQNVSGIKRKLEMDEGDATIARRTRSKLSLSSTSIEHIESTFVPPDDIPMPAVDDLWNQFLSECLDPAPTSRNEDDDEADPEYNVAADHDAGDEDDENLGNSLIKISKKELNDLVTELFGIMPEALDTDPLAEVVDYTVLTATSQTNVPTQWNGKQEPLSDGEEAVNISNSLTFENRDQNTSLSIGKTELEVDEGNNENLETSTVCLGTNKSSTQQKSRISPRPGFKSLPRLRIATRDRDTVQYSESEGNLKAPPILRYLKLNTNISRKCDVLKVEIGSDFKVLPEQIQIIQQQLRQHVQLTTSNFLQLYVHPLHWSFGPMYKKYIETFIAMCESNPHSIANVCNLRPALDLMVSWEKSVAEDTPKNAEMIKFIQEDSERSQRRILSNNMAAGEFHDTLKDVVANSTVFLYPYLLPPAPFRSHPTMRKFSYLQSEDELIAVGLDEFWQYIESNSRVFRIRLNSRAKTRPGLLPTVELMSKHMFPWIVPKVLMNHILHIKNHGHTENPIVKFFKSYKSVPVEHKLLPFNPQLTLYEQPETEIPRNWLKYLARTSKRFKAHFHRSSRLCVRAPDGVPVEMGKLAQIPAKNPLPIDYTKEIISNGSNQSSQPNLIDKFDVNVNTGVTQENVVMPTNLFRVVETSTGAFLVPCTLMSTNTVNSTDTPICSSGVIEGTVVGNNLPENSITMQKNARTHTGRTRETEISKWIRIVDIDHCQCCNILRRVFDGGQTSIIDFLIPNKSVKKLCYCKNLKYQKITNRLKLFISNYKCQSKLLYQEIENKLTGEDKVELENGDFYNAGDAAFATHYHLRLLRRINTCKVGTKNRIDSLFLKFNIAEEDPVTLARKLHKAVNVDLIELYTEFIGFLTPEQAETEEVFNAYLASHLRGLIKMIDEEMADKEKRNAVLKQLKTIFTDKNSTPCQTCSALLPLLKGYPRIAKHLFSLFPHRRKERYTEQLQQEELQQQQQQEEELQQQQQQEELQQQEQEELQQQSQQLPKIENNEIHIDSQLESTEGLSLPMLTCDSEEAIMNEETYETSPPLRLPGNIQITCNSNCIVIQPVCEDTTTYDDSDDAVNQSRSKENDDSNDSLDSPMVIIEEEIKSEPVEWKRDEDKLILEMLKQSLTPEERKNKTIIEIIEEKNILNEISNCLTDKTIDEIQERILCLLEILVIGEN